MGAAWQLGGLGSGLVVLTIFGLALHIPGELGIGSDDRMAVFVALACLAGVLYAGAVRLVLRQRPGWGAMWVILGITVVVGVFVVVWGWLVWWVVFGFVWDGRVQAAGINPYRYIPADPALVPLREDAIFPHINRADYAPTIYPPLAQAVFLAVASISQTTRAMKIAMTGFDLVMIVVLLRLLTAAGLKRERVLIYAWHPLPVWEIAGNGHVDALAIALIGLAMLAQVGRRRFAAGTLLAGAVLVKILPAVLLPAFWRRWDWRFLAVFAAVIVAAYLCYSSAGWHVFGFLGGYAAEEGIASGGGIYPVFALGHFVALPDYAGKIYLGLLACLLGGIGLAMVFSRADAHEPRRLAGRVLVLTTVVTVGLSPHYPWYFCWLLPASCLVPSYAVLYLSFASFLIYLNPIHSELLWPTMVYVPFVLLALIEFFWRRSHAPVAVAGVVSGRP